MKRQRGRGGRKSNGHANRHYESNGPDVKIRGSASHIFEKYQQLARDVSSSGDRIVAENYLQHAEHYYRVVQATQPPPKPQRERTEADGADAPQPGLPAGTGGDASPALDVVASGEGEDDQPIIANATSPEADRADAPKPARRSRRPRRSASGSDDTSEARAALDTAARGAPSDVVEAGEPNPAG